MAALLTFEKKIHSTFYLAWDYLSLLELKLAMLIKRAPGTVGQRGIPNVYCREVPTDLTNVRLV